MRVKHLMLFFLFSTFLLSVAHPAESRTDVDVNIGIGLPPPFVFEAPPEVVLIPGTYVYFVPGIDVDVLFYHGYWYRPFEGRWYRGRSYRGPWGYIGPSRVPRALHGLPHDYRHVPPGHERIPYGHLNKNWRRWERERHWDRGMREERREHREGRDRGEHRGGGRGRY